MISPDTQRFLVPCLTASAVVLAGLLLARLGEHPAVPEAQARMYNQQAPFTLVSAGIADDEEGLFVLDNATGTLLVYKLTTNNREMVLANGLRVDRLFAAAQEEGGITLEGAAGEDEDDDRDRDRDRRDRRDR